MSYYYFTMPEVNPRRLINELRGAGLTDSFFTYHEESVQLIVSTEMGDPTPVVEAHDPTPDIPLDWKQAVTAIRDDMLAAKALVEALPPSAAKDALVAMGKCVRNLAKFVGYRIGRLEASDAEHQQGLIDLES